jgi:DNA topoisomerase IA
MNIVVVESPAKAKTINKYLGPGYEVLASFGHIRDLPPKDGSVDPDANFKMIWEVDERAQKRINDIARAVKGADKLILATDPDREGEAISWHVLEVLKEKNALKDQEIERVVFNAITKQAVTDAMKHPRKIDHALVDAYLARRALDYLVGFTLSPVLWRKLPGARSAGRVQSVALRLVCDRELEIEKFVAREYWSLVATLATPRNDLFEARLVGADGSISAPARKPRISRRRSRPRPSRSRRSRPSRRAAILRPPSPPRPCSRKPAASSALRPPIPCALRNGCMKASISTARPWVSLRICEPTASTWRRKPLPASVP